MPIRRNVRTVRNRVLTIRREVGERAAGPASTSGSRENDPAQRYRADESEIFTRVKSPENRFHRTTCGRLEMIGAGACGDSGNLGTRWAGSSPASRGTNIGAVSSRTGGVP